MKRTNGTLLCAFAVSVLPSIGLAADAELPGKQLQELPRLDAEILAFHVPRQIQGMCDAGKAVAPEADAMIAAGQKAFDSGDSYRAYRLFARAFGLAGRQARALECDVAAAIALKLNRAVFWPGETIEVTLDPMYDTGVPLPGLFQARLWLETARGVEPDTERTIGIREMKRQMVTYPAAIAPAGPVSVGYELTSPEGESLVRVYYTLAVMPAGRPALSEMRAVAASLDQRTDLKKTPSVMTALETVDYVVEGLARDSREYGGHWRRWMLPFAVRFGSDGERPGFWGPVRCPEDIDLALELIRNLQAGREPLAGRRGDMRLAMRLSDGQLMSFRLFVPEGSEQARGLVIALHSGAGDHSYFEWESFSLPVGKPYVNAFKKLTQHYSLMAAAPAGYGEPAGFGGERGTESVLALVDRLQALYAVPARNTFLAGWSVGSSDAWRIAMSHPERFAGLAAVAGEASWLTEQATAGAAKLPVLFIAGERDPGIEKARTTRDLARRFLPLFQYQQLAGAEHRDTWPRAVEAVFAFFDQTLRSGDIKMSLKEEK